jgi:hypothetical protein
MLGKLRRQRVDVRANHRAVFRRERFGHDRDLFAALEVLEAGRILVAEIDLRRIEDVEDDQVVAEEPERLDRFENRVGLLVEIRNQHENAAALEVLGHLVQRNRQVARSFGPRAVERMQDDIEVLRRRRDLRDDVVVERDGADAVALALRQVGETGADVAAVIQLRDPLAGELHRSRDVEQHRQVGVGVGLVLLHVVAIGAREQPPVDPADVVAGDVAAVLGEVDRGAEERRPVVAVDEPFDDVARQQLEVADARQDLRVDESGAGNRV